MGEMFSVVPTDKSLWYNSHGKYPGSATSSGVRDA
jgi:hypothetical protein